MSNSKSTKITVYPFYKGCVFPLEVECVSLLRNTANKMVLDGLKAKHSIADQVNMYTQQLDHIVPTVAQYTKSDKVVAGSARGRQSLLWCLNVMALEKMKALSLDDKNGTMIMEAF